MLSLIKSKKLSKEGKGRNFLGQAGKSVSFGPATTSSTSSRSETPIDLTQQSRTLPPPPMSTGEQTTMLAAAPSATPAPAGRSSSGRHHHRQQPRLGLSGVFDEDPGIMSEAETASTSSTRGRRDRQPRPRTSPNQPPRGYSPLSRHHQHSALGMAAGDDDSGIMSEAETASTSRHNHSSSKRRSRNSIPMGSLSLNRPFVNSTLFEEEDPGIMSEAETASTSSKTRRRSQRHGSSKPSLPVVRTPSKTLERPLGIVFLICRGETKRALLPNEITSIITVKALFVRSFNKVLTMDYMDSPRVHIYIHDGSKDIFYELEDMNEIRDRTILKVFEADSSGKGPEGLGPAGLPPITNTDELQGYSPVGIAAMDKDTSKAKNFARTNSTGSATLPRNAFSTTMDAASSTVHQNAALIGGNERSRTLIMPGAQRLGQAARVESGYISSPDGNYEYDSGHQEQVQQRIPTRFGGSSGHGRYFPGHPANAEEAKARMMHMEAQLSQLTGMVEKALKNKKLGKKQVSFDKSVTFSDEVQTSQPQSILSKRHRRDVSNSHSSYSEVQGQLKRLHKSTRELKQEVRVLRRLTQLQSMAMKDLVQDTYLKLREACISFSAQNGLVSSAENLEHLRIAQDEEAFSRELNELLAAIADLEAKVEEVRSGVINKKNKILLSDVEALALALSHCSKTVTQLRQAFPALEANLKANGSSSKEEPGLMAEFLKRSGDRLDNAWKRCKKLTGTLVTLKRLASVQEQRFHPAGVLGADISLSPTPCSTSRTPVAKDSTLDDLLDALQTYTMPPRRESSASPAPAGSRHGGRVTPDPTKAKSGNDQKLKSSSNRGTSSVVNAAAATASPLKKQVGNGEVVKPPPNPPPRITQAGGSGAVKSAPPPPPPRTSSTHKTAAVGEEPSEGSNKDEGAQQQLRGKGKSLPGPAVAPKPPPDIIASSTNHELMLETRHRELLSRQKQLQEQYQRLQEMQKRSSSTIKTMPATTAPPPPPPVPIRSTTTLTTSGDGANEGVIAKEKEEKNEGGG